MAGKVYTITGVMPRGWKFPIQNEKVDYVAPILRFSPIKRLTTWSGAGRTFSRSSVA